jgi:hypothetical protein
LVEPLLLITANFVKPFFVIPMQINPLKELQCGEQALEFPGVWEVIPQL